MPRYVSEGQWQALTSYCEGDVLNTWLVFLRWALLKGLITEATHQLWIQRSIDYLNTQPQHGEFLQLWCDNSKHTEFTASDFSPDKN